MGHKRYPFTLPAASCIPSSLQPETTIASKCRHSSAGVSIHTVCRLKIDVTFLPPAMQDEVRPLVPWTLGLLETVPPAASAVSIQQQQLCPLHYPSMQCSLCLNCGCLAKSTAFNGKQQHARRLVSTSPKPFVFQPNINCIARIIDILVLLTVRHHYRRHDFRARLVAFGYLHDYVPGTLYISIRVGEGLCTIPRCVTGLLDKFRNIYRVATFWAASVRPSFLYSRAYSKSSLPLHYGGGRVPVSQTLKGSALEPWCLSKYPLNGAKDVDFQFVRYVKCDGVDSICAHDSGLIPCRLPVHNIADWLTRLELQNLATLHGIRHYARDSKPTLKSRFVDHHCNACDLYVSLFTPYDALARKRQCDRNRQQLCREKSKGTKLSTKEKSGKNPNINSKKRKLNRDQAVTFPPPPPSSSTIEQIVHDYCADTSPSMFQESGCAVCGQLNRLTDLSPLSDIKGTLTSLHTSGVSRKERLSAEDPITELDGPVIDERCKYVCSTCYLSLKKNRIPKHALANGLWMGSVPKELQGLTFSERMMIARVRHNRCIIRVSSGRAKMVANVIMHSSPVLKVYHTLPPSREEMNEVLAFIFTGSNQPTEEDFKRTPFLVRRDRVSRALDWLKLNHCDYKDLEISRDNLESYPLSGVPVAVSYKQTDPGESNKLQTTMSIHDNDEEDGAEDGNCPFTVHGITGNEYSKLSMTALKARALRHLEDGGMTLGIGHEDKPQSMYDNPQVYPQMFPWLFPYGYGGIGQTRLKKKLSETEHKKCLLMYHDKRFQTDLYFPIVAFNHEQMKAGTTGSFLLTKRQNFGEISRRLMSLNRGVLADLMHRLADGEYVRPESDEEKACFSVLDDLDHVGGHIKGSLTSKKYMRNEIWSLISSLGAPSWFITISPADNRHPICLYFADTNEKFSPELRTSAERNRLIASNPVAAARFFDLVVRSFIKNVLGVDHDHPGLYGKTSGYYGTVEQQGRLTLHLHLLLWLEGALPPQKIRDKLMSKDSKFQHDLVAYLEGTHKGEFSTGSVDFVRASVPLQTEFRGGIHAVDRSPKGQNPAEYADPTQTLPVPPPRQCVCSDGNCGRCKATADWWREYHTTVDDLLLKTNVHKCSASSVNREAQDDDVSGAVMSKSKRVVSAKQGTKGCLDRNGVCRARFPREIHECTKVDNGDGHIFMKKLEPYLNTFTPCLTYLTRCNTDVTSLLSGTSIKAIVSYISDYVTKPVLKTHQIFASMYDIFERNNMASSGDIKKDKDDSRRLILKIVNSLSAKLEMGSPMASMYLLGNPDHYTGHTFVTFWWKSYVSFILRNVVRSESLPQGDGIEQKLSTDHSVGAEEERVRLGREDGTYIATSNVDDYRYRPDAYESMSLYEWIQTSHRRRATKKEIESMKSPSRMAPYQSSSGYLQFKNGHPMQSTHLVKCDMTRLKHVVPNIVGGPLPRYDRGDREYYCCTMLTLFRTWRSSTCLKTDDQSWDDAFNGHTFTVRENQLIHNFNLRYECLDARDDFHAQLKKKTQTRGPWFDHGSTDDESDREYVHPPPTGYIDHSTTGRSYLSSLRMMDAMSSVLATAGWLDRHQGAMAALCERLHPAYRPGTSWANIVKTCREAIFKKKYAGYTPPDPDQSVDSPVVNKPNELVRVLPASYFCKNFRAEKYESSCLIESTIVQFSLNPEQERAFRIIANHASTVAIEQLKMHLGGMGGTGKTQVIKALIHLFEQRGESHRFIVLAPTGTAAALLNGSTYHKALGIRWKGDVGEDFSRSESSVLNEARSRLQGVQYIFVDEVSMIACHELYSISARLAQITNTHDVAFGGLNVILAGDFAQLPPVFGLSLYDGNVETFVNSRMSLRDQESVMGKILWHQITTVVILKQNMRQKSQSESDAKLRTALENMRYAACTADDIEFLRSRIAGRGNSSPSLAVPHLRNVSIITARNNQRDRINEEGSRRFAQDHGLRLTNFYSLDELAGGDEARTRGRKRKGQRKSAQNTREPALSNLTKEDQEALWDCSPHTSEHVAGKLPLCVGMPVIIRNNEATELCITKGQEAIVVGWDALEGPYDHQILETLFVRLTNPPKTVQLADLPANVVPLTRTTGSIVCKAKSDQPIRIKRQQIPVLLNFAMTDYSSQGKTRPLNVVDLGYCRDHQSYYTALSRSASAEGTILVQDFSQHKITRGISGWLRQEFRELNVLDEVTRLRYEGLLPDGIFGPLRNPIIRSYYTWIKDKKDDLEWHSAIQYRTGEMKIKPVASDPTWDINIAATTPVKDRKPTVSLKRTRSDKNSNVDSSTSKVARHNDPRDANVAPRGLIWDSHNYSCAYDSLLTVLYNIWLDKTAVWSRRFEDISAHMSLLSEQFHLARLGRITIEEARNAVHREFHQQAPSDFPLGPVSTCIATLASTLIENRESQLCGSSFWQCLSCGHQGETIRSFSEFVELSVTGPFQDNKPRESLISDCLGWYLSDQQRIGPHPCPACLKSSRSMSQPMSLQHFASRLPYIMCFVFNTHRFRINHSLTYLHDQMNVTFNLRGIVYGDGHHFVSRIVSKNGDIWFHDGIATRSSCVRESHLDFLPDDDWLKTTSQGYSNRKAILVIYARE